MGFYKLLAHLLDLTHQRNVVERISNNEMAAILQVYRDMDKGLSPRTEDLDEALLTFLTYTRDLVNYQKGSPEHTDMFARSKKKWAELVSRYTDAASRAEKALKAGVPDTEKAAALDSMIDLMHNDMYALEHFAMGQDDAVKGMALEIIKILRGLGKFKKAGYKGRDDDNWFTYLGRKRSKTGV